MNQPAIDLSRHHFMKPSGDLVLFGSWLWNADQEDYEPALILVPRYRRDGFKPVCVALSAAYKYNSSAQYLARASQIFAKMLGMEDNMSTVHKIGELIHSHISDLIKIPPSPTRSIVVADASYTVDGKTHSAEILDYKPLAQA